MSGGDDGDVYPLWKRCSKVALPGFCGGTIVNSRHVITAGHCTQYRKSCSVIYSGYRVDYPANRIAVRVGVHDISDHTAKGEQMIHVKRIIRHPDYFYKENQKPRNDIAILFLSWPVDIMKYTPACLARRTAGLKFNGKMAKAVGWGKDIYGQFSRDYPLEVDLKVDSRTRSEPWWQYVQVTQQTGKGTCKVTKSIRVYKVTHH